MVVTNRDDGGFLVDTEEFNEELEDGEQVLEEEANQMLKSWNPNQLLKEIQDKAERTERDEKAIADIYDGETDFDDIIKTMRPLDPEPSERPSVFLKILEANPGGKLIKAINTILFDCIGYLENECQPFESTIHDGRPKKLNLREGPIIPGLLAALLDLREGERANIMIRSEMAYGPLGTYNRDIVIPGNATIMYHVKILRVWDESQLEEILEYERVHYLDVPLEEKLPAIEEIKRVANEYLRDGQIKDALVKYKMAIKELESGCGPAMLYQSQRTKPLLVALFQNSAIAYNQLGMHRSASKMAYQAITIEPKCIKAYYQLIKARLALNDHLKAEQYLDKATAIFPDCPQFDALKLELNHSSRAQRQMRDDMMKRMAQAFK